MLKHSLILLGLAVTVSGCAKVQPDTQTVAVATEQTKTTMPYKGIVRICADGTKIYQLDNDSYAVWETNDWQPLAVTPDAACAGDRAEAASAPTDSF